MSAEMPKTIAPAIKAEMRKHFEAWCDQSPIGAIPPAPKAAAWQAWQEATRQAMEECRRLVLHEVLHLEDVICEEDVAYNTAIDHAQKAIANRIRALADVDAKEGRSE